MNTPDPSMAGRPGRGAPGAEWAWVETMLGLQPFPSLLVEEASGRVLLGNEAALRVPLEPPAGDARPELYYATDAQGRRLEHADLGRRLARGAAGPDGAEIAWNTPDRAFRFRVHSRALPAAGGRPALCMLIFLDVTRERAAEAELRQALEARNEFFSVATHELKDPLFSLQLSIQLLRHTAGRQGEVPQHVLDHLDVSQRQADRLSRLIDNLLDVSRIMNRRLALDIEVFDVADLARESAARFEAQARTAGTSIEVVAPGPAVGYFDRMKLEQVVGNLLSNALKYGEGRPVTVRVRAEGDEAVLEVEDRGVGIAPEDQPRIFGRFERASDDHRKESLGLGLFIVRSLVEAHGGSIAVQSEPGRGTTFTVRLPRNRLPHQDGAEAGRGGAAATGG